MIKTSIEIDEKTMENIKKSGITLRNLIKMGLKSIENTKEKNEDMQNMEKNISVLARKIAVLMQVNAQLETKYQEITGKKE